MQFTDAVAVAGTRRSADGYLIADAKAVRTGIQVYAGTEVGRPDLAQVRVYRSEAEVRSADSLRSFSHAPITIGHPAEPVTADNWRQLAVGEVSTAATWDGNRIALPLILKDAAAVRAAENGLRELSAGYTCDLDWTAGTAPDGQTFDAQQKNIRANHLAMVPRGRAGPECRIGDADTAAWGAAPLSPTPQSIRDTVPMKTMTIDGHPVEISDAGAIAVANVQRQLSDALAAALLSDKALNDAKTTHAKALSDKDGEVLKLQADHKVALDAKDKEISDLKAKAVTADKLDAAVAERSAVLDAAKPWLGDGFDAKGKTVADIRKATVAKRLGDKAVEGKDDAHITVAFDTLTALAPQQDALGRAISDSLPNPDHSGRAPVILDSAGIQAKRNRELADAWKQAPAGAA